MHVVAHVLAHEHDCPRVINNFAGIPLIHEYLVYRNCLIRVQGHVVDMTARVSLKVPHTNHTATTASQARDCLQPTYNTAGVGGGSFLF